MRNAVAFANNDVATIAWSYGAKPGGLHGFRAVSHRFKGHGDGAAEPRGVSGRDHLSSQGDSFYQGFLTYEMTKVPKKKVAYA